MGQSTDAPISVDVVMHTIFNDQGEPLTITHDTLLEQCLTLGIFDLSEESKTILYGNIFRAHLKRAKRLLNALDGLARDKDSEVAKREYGEARRGVEANLLYYKFDN